MIKRLLIVALIFSNSFAFAQFKQDFAHIKEKYKAYNAIVLDNESTLFLDIKDDKIVASQKVKEQRLILNEHSKAFSNDNIFFQVSLVFTISKQNRIFPKEINTKSWKQQLLKRHTIFLARYSTTTQNCYISYTLG